MIKPIAFLESKEGYVFEEENRFEIALVRYEEVDGKFISEEIEIFQKEEFVDMKSEEELRDFLKKYGIKEEDSIYLREAAEEIPVPFSFFNEEYEEEAY